MSNNLNLDLNPNPCPPTKEKKEIINVLALDGGGVRGLVPLRFLQGIEKATGKPIHKIFHTIVGTSTGGLITALLSLPRQTTGEPVTAKEAVEIYKGFGPKIFPKKLFGLKLSLLGFIAFVVGASCLSVTIRSLKTNDDQTYTDLIQTNNWALMFGILFLICIIVGFIFFVLLVKNLTEPKYPREGIEGFCDKHFGVETRLKNAWTNIGIVATDLLYRRTFVFNSMRSRISPNCELHNAPIRQIARATSAAPTYFQPQHFVLDPSKTKISQGQGDQGDATTPWDSRNPEALCYAELLLFEDGGTKMNNPSKAALRLAEQQLREEGKNPDDYEFRLLSMGTGSLSGEQDDPIYAYFNKIVAWMSKFGPLQCLTRLRLKGEFLGGLTGVIRRRLTADVFEVMINAHNDHLEMYQHYKGMEKLEYYRRQQFKVTQHQLDEMDDCSEKNMDDLVERAENMLVTGGDDGQEQKKIEWSDELKKCVRFLDLEAVNEPEKPEVRKLNRGKSKARSSRHSPEQLPLINSEYN